MSCDTAHVKIMQALESIYLTLLTVNRNVFGAIGWVCLIVLLEFMCSPKSKVPLEYGDAISRGCGYIDNHLCVQGGCYYSPQIIKSGPYRPSLTRTIPTFVELQYRAGYFRWDKINITKLQSVECAIIHNVKETQMEILVSLIPALSLAAIIIVLLVFLKSANQPYLLTKHDETLGVDEIPMKEFAISNDDSEDDDVEVLDNASSHGESSPSVAHDEVEDQNAITSKNSESPVTSTSAET